MALRKTSRVVGAVAVLAITSLAVNTALASDLGARVSVNIAAQPLEAALLELSKQGHLQLVIATGSLPARTSERLAGNMPLRSALHLLLEGSGFTYKLVGDHTIAIVRIEGAPAQPSQSSPPPTVIPENSADPAPSSFSPDAAVGDQRKTSGETTVKHHGWLARIASFFVACGASSFSCAQAQSAAGAELAEPEGLQEIVVTAQRREESVQRTPITINVVSGAQLVSEGATDVIRASELIPGVQVVPSQLNGAQIAIRGIVNNNPNVGSDPSLAMSVDDVYIARAQAALASFYDIARVEVLKGPQGTLYGRNSVSGAMNIVTNDPKHEWGADGYVEFGNYNAKTFEGAFNAPIGEHIALRLAGQEVKHSGYIDDYWTNEDNKAGRAKLLVELSDKASVLLSASIFHQVGVGDISPAYPFANASNPWNPSETVPRGTSYTDNLVNNYSLKFNWDTFLGNLTYIRGYTRFGENISLPPGFAAVIRRIGTSKQNTDEVRLASHSSADVQGHFAWVAGIFTYDETQDQFRHVEVPGFGNLIQDAGYPHVYAQSVAEFAQGTYAILDHLRVTLGVRNTNESKNAIGTNSTSQFGAITVANENVEEKDSKVNYRLAIEGDLTPSSLLYASVTTGFHGGGWMDSPPPYETYRPETITSFEVGSKNEFLDHRLRVNAGAYYYDYKNFLVSVQSALAPTCACFVNAPKARAEGVEVESQFAITSYDTLSVNFAYEDSDYTNFKVFFPFSASLPGGTPIPATGTSPAGVDYSGTPFPYVSKWSGNASLQHIFPLPNGADINATVFTQYRTVYPGGLGDDPGLRQPGYTKTDVSVGYNAPKNRWSVTLYARNLERAPAVFQAGRGPGPPGPANPITVGLGEPRTFGVRLAARY
jgi:iron complex outermembrane recepter protein